MKSKIGDFWTQNRTNIFIYIFFLLLPWIYYWSLWTFFSPDLRIINGDFYSAIFPYRYYLATMLREGFLPLWTPYLYGGMPFIGEIQTGVFYPLNFILCLFVIKGELWYIFAEMIMLFQFSLAGIFMYLFLKHVGFHSFSGIMGALVFMFNGFMIMRTGHPNMFGVVIWLPLILLLSFKAIKTGRFRWAVFAGCTLGVSTLSGHLQLTAILYIIIFLFFIFLSLQDFFNSRERGKLIRYVLLFLVIVIVSIGLAAVQILPAYEFIKLSTKSEINYEDSTLFSMFPKDLILNFIFPSMAMYESTCYVGILPLLLLPIGLAWCKHSLKLFFLILFILSLFLALGRYSFLYDLVYQFIPLYGKNRVPGRFMFVSVLCFSFFTSMGCEVLIQSLDSKKKETIIKILRVAIYFLAASIGVFLFLAVIMKIGPVAYEKLLKGVEQDLYDRMIWVIFIFSLGLLIIYYRSIINSKLSFFYVMMISVLLIDLFSTNEGISLEKGTSRRNPYSSLSYNKNWDCGRIYVQDGRSSIERVRNIGGYTGLFHQAYTTLLWGSKKARSLMNTIEESTCFLPPYFLLHKAIILPYEKIQDKKTSNVLKEVFSPEFNPISYIVIESDEPGLHSNFIKGVDNSDQLIRENIFGWDFKEGINLTQTNITGESFRVENKKLILIPQLNPNYNPKTEEFKFLTIVAKSNSPGQIKISVSGISPSGSKGNFQLTLSLETDNIWHSYLFGLGHNRVEQITLESGQYDMLIKAVKLDKNPILTTYFSPNKIEISANCPEDSYLFLSEVYYPGWITIVDGKIQKTYRANYAFRAIYLTKGNHNITMNFSPKSFYIGAIISLIFLGTVLGMVTNIIFRSKRKV